MAWNLEVSALSVVSKKVVFIVGWLLLRVWLTMTLNLELELETLLEILFQKSSLEVETR